MPVSRLEPLPERAEPVLDFRAEPVPDFAAEPAVLRAEPVPDLLAELVLDFRAELVEVFPPEPVAPDVFACAILALLPTAAAGDTFLVLLAVSGEFPELIPCGL